MNILELSACCFVLVPFFRLTSSQTQKTKSIINKCMYDTNAIHELKKNIYRMEMDNSKY